MSLGLSEPWTQSHEGRRSDRVKLRKKSRQEDRRKRVEMTFKSLALVIPETGVPVVWSEVDICGVSLKVHSLLSAPVISQSMHCIALLLYLFWGAHVTQPHKTFVGTFCVLFSARLEATLLVFLPVVCLSALRSIPHPSLFCIARTTFLSFLCSLAYQYVWLMGSTSRRLALEGEDKPVYLFPSPQPPPQLVSLLVVAAFFFFL